MSKQDRLAAAEAARLAAHSAKLLAQTDYIKGSNDALNGKKPANGASKSYLSGYSWGKYQSDLLNPAYVDYQM